MKPIPRTYIHSATINRSGPWRRCNIDTLGALSTAKLICVHTSNMKISSTISIGAVVALNAVTISAKHTHDVLAAFERRHLHHGREAKASPAERGPIPEKPKLAKRSTCDFPSDAGLVAVTPGSSNGGWAMSPDQPCALGSYCPYACPSGQMSMQWDPSATSYPSMVSII